MSREQWLGFVELFYMAEQKEKRMTRMVVAVEDDVTPFQYAIAKWALTSEAPVPVVFAADDTIFVGMAKEFERDTETWEISMELDVHLYLVDLLPQYEAYAYVQPLEAEDGTVTKGIIKQVMLYDKRKGYSRG